MFSSNTSSAAGDANYIEDVFSTYLYTGNGSTQTITNGIDLSGKGGMVWVKKRNAAQQHNIYDSARGWDAGGELITNTTDAAQDKGSGYFSVSSTGFSLPTAVYNTSSDTYASWTFREQRKFFDVVTWTGTGSAQNIAHNLGSVPGCIIVKRTDTTSDWKVYHTSIGNTQFLRLNSTDLAASSTSQWNNTSPTSTVFSLGTDGGVNGSGGTFVAYLFAHNAGGFGLTGNDNVISCGSFTTDGSAAATVNLGYEPQWILFKQTNAAGQWFVRDTMRGWPTPPESSRNLYPNLSNAEENGGGLSPTSTGFQVAGLGASNTYIYIAIRRGPMKVPTTGTSVYNGITTTGDPSNVSVGFPTDWVIHNSRTTSSQHWVTARLIGGTQYTATNSTAAEASFSPDSDKYDLQNNFTSAPFYGGSNQITYFMRRAPGFMDVCCYTGTGVARTVAHNLAAVPELMIVKTRDSTGNWLVYSATLGNAKVLLLNSTSGEIADPNIWSSTSPTSSVFTIGSSYSASGQTYVAYLFASCPGVSKVFSYTGNGSSQTINCGFTGGARFVMIKRTDSTGDWYVWDTARGIVAGNDPHLSLNTTAAEVTSNDTIDTDSTGFVVNQVAATNINVNAATYIGLAIA